MIFNSEKIIYYSVPGGTLLYAPNEEIEVIKSFFNFQNEYRVYSGIDSVMIFHDETTTIEDLKKVIQSNIISATNVEAPKVIFTIPVFYDLETKDWPFLEKTLHLEREEIITLHQNSMHSLEMYGFLPGFPYFKNKSHSWQIPRKSVPDKKINAGSIALADDYTGIYPVDSPGGWHIIGACPVRFLNSQSDQPVLYAVGSQIRFEAISKSTYLTLL